MRRIVAAALPTAESRSFFRWAVGAYAVVTVVLLAASLRRTDGAMVYALDDPAIHLSIAETLVHHGTWGVEPGQFQSASSAPLWTVLIAGFVLVAPFVASYAALLLNGLAAAAVVALLARGQTTLHPSRRRPLDVLATAVIAVVVLFLPAATFVGMEHLLHAALVLAAVQSFSRPPASDAPAWRRAAPYVLVALASLTRMETAWVAAALGVAVLATCLPRPDGASVPPWAPQLRRVVLLGLSAGLPIVAFSLFNLAMGQSWLPNSVVAKSASLNGEGGGFDLLTSLGRLTADSVLALLVILCTGLAIAGWRERRRWFVPAATTVLASLAHVTLAEVGWYERYQIYLIVLAVYTLSLAAGDLLPGGGGAEASTGAGAGTAPSRRSLAPLFVLSVLLLSAIKVDLTLKVPRAIDDTYEQRYQAAVFLDRYYDGQPVATGELGYISLEHNGPITDLYGLGDYEVLQARRRFHQQAPPEYWSSLAVERGFRVVAVYPTTLLLETPPHWILVGSWTIPRDAVSAFTEEFQFWATVPEEVAPLITHLEEFAAELPAGVESRIQDLAQYRADVMLAEQGS